MRQAVIPAVVATLLAAGTLGRDLPDDVVREPHRVVGRDAALPDSYPQTSPVNQILVTADNQILVELAPDEATRPNLFDLNGRTLVFTPDGQGGYSRAVMDLEGEEEIGEEVQSRADTGTVILLESFHFPFAGQRWDSLHLGPPGVLTFGGPFTYTLRYPSGGLKGNAGEFISGPTISALFRPYRYGTTHVTQWTDRIVVTWISTDSSFYWPYGVEPEKPARFQTVLGTDGSIRFNYIDVHYEDGIAGLFQEEGLTAGVDLSQSQSRASNLHHEVFHFKSNFNIRREVVCELLRALGDEFDLFVFHSEFRLDNLGSSTSWAHPGSVTSRGCTQGRLKGYWIKPVWIQSRAVFEEPLYFEDDDGFDDGLHLFAHEFGHTWLAYFFYDKSGQRQPLFYTFSEGGCGCHWRREFHTPAAFPWRGRPGEIGRDSIMGGSFWIDHGNGRFSSPASSPGGFSWLDLYAMGLADAEEVPDMFIVRNLQSNNDPNTVGHYTGD